jgi:hypothetical protein
VTLLLWFTLVAVLLVALDLGYIWLRAWFEVKGLPRGETYICNKHGPMQKESTISFIGVPYCPLCFHERLQSAERIPVNGPK